MNIQSRKLQVLQDVMLVDDEQTLHGIEQLLRLRRVMAYEGTLTPMTEDELRARVRQSEEDFGQGRVVEAQDLLNRFK